MAWLLSLLFIICILLFAFNKKKQRKFRQLPSPPGLPIIGNLHQIGELPHQDLWKLSKKYGPVMGLKLGTVPTVVVSSCDTARQVLKVQDLNCCSRPDLIGPRELTYNLLDIAFAPYDVYWKEIRKLGVQELFSAKQVHLSQSIKDEEVKKLMESIGEKASQNAPVSLNKTFLALTVSIICRVAFGVSYEGTVLNSDEFSKIVREALEMLGSFSASDFIPYVGWIIDILTGLKGRRDRSKRDLEAFYEQVFDMHKKEKREGSEDFVDLLFNLEKEEAVLGKDRLTQNHMKGILMDVLLAGIDTSAITMTWAMTELAKNPRVMKKVQAEIRSQIKNKDSITCEDTDKLEYLKMVIKETWRVHPTTPLLLPREVISDLQIDGYTIPAKTRLHVNVWAIGRDPNTWKDPEVFLPERFMDSNIDAKGQHFELLPFGGGRRMCPAVYMGSTMVEFGLANLLYHFDWKLPEGMKAEDIDVEEAPGLTVNRKTDLLLVPEKYSDPLN